MIILIATTPMIKSAPAEAEFIFLCFYLFYSVHKPSLFDGGFPFQIKEVVTYAYTLTQYRTRRGKYGCSILCMD